MRDRPLEYRPHPWHGVDPGKHFPEIVRAYIEIVPTDGVKYEIDKHSGYLMVDRPQRFSSFCPTLYGFVPRTYCGDRVAAYALAGSPLVSQLPRPIIDRLRHYFLTYKALPGDAPNPITVDPLYDATEARGILAAARADYAHAFPD